MTMGRTALRCPAVLALYFVCMGLLYPILAENELKIWEISATGEVGSTANVKCNASDKSELEWWFEGNKVIFDERITKIESKGELSSDRDGSKTNTTISTITIANATSADAGNYTCVAKKDGLEKNNVANLNLSFPAKAINIADSPIERKVSENVTVECIFEVYGNVSEVRWYKIGEDQYHHPETPWRINARQIKSEHTFLINKTEENGTYACEIEDSVSQSKVFRPFVILVKGPATVTLDAVIAINTTEVFINWTVCTYNSEVRDYYISTMKVNNTKNTGFVYYSSYNNKPVKVDVNQTSFIIKGLENSTEYQIKLEVNTTYPGISVSPVVNVKTLDKEPIFIPNISINGFSATSVTIGWAPPPPDTAKLIHYYLLEAKKKNEEGLSKAYHSQDGRNLPYMFDNLKPHSTYIFKVRACSDYITERCGPWSDEMEAATLDGVPSKPDKVEVYCDRNYMNVSWTMPLRPNAEIKGYTMELTGVANYKDRFGNNKPVTWGPLSKFTTNDSRRVRFDDLQPYMNYTVKLSAMTRTRRRGEEASRNCMTQPAPPDQPPRPRWRKIIEQEKYMFKMYLPRISERNGPICCYRVYMVRLLPYTDWKTLPPPKELPILDYEEAHASEPKTQGAYITDIFSNERFPMDSELVMGDSKIYFDKNEPKFKSGPCQHCLLKPERYPRVSTTTTTTTTSTTPADHFGEDDTSTEDVVYTEVPPPDVLRDRRSYENYRNFGQDDMMQDTAGDDGKDVNPKDGELDPNSNYTLFVELIPDIENESPMFSHCVNTLMPAPTPIAPQPTTAVEIALQATCAIAALVLLLMIVFCIRHTRRARKVPPHAHLELNPLQMALRYITGRGGRSQMVPSAPPDMAPIAKEDLAAAYAERQVDSDYGFQKEFELLPECFVDRTTHASEARENQPKNRYPDIKAYDQTRVKLSQIDSITGSDYINANYVMGYQERKQFICAQGPTDTTVNDFWRMIWEHGLELIVMLTNLEEYSKVKCSKYWPDEVRGARAFGNITVQHVSERRYSDYIVRELRITKQPTTADGQPIVENNGIKRNGDCKEAGDGSVPTSPREVKEADARIVKQYHFLMWKDFAAPEHAYSILKFIKRVNEAWSNMVGRPCVVHCSAGVGRTGTLVALDCLLEQLRAQGHAAVFNTVADLRRQRNFLVQSLKQYVFVYRALVEYAHYGDTEIPACKLKSSIDRLRNTPPGAANCLMEIEFEKILNSPIPEPLKSCAAGAAEELRSKNRSQDILPYDRNRVILAPISTRDYSTYINASFIEAYDNSEGFIITQDPLPCTIMDFWRMVSEHNVSTIVMLSELGEGKCPRYWDDNTAQYEHISVQYDESESCPYYTRRQFRVNNNKVIGETGLVVRHLQYQGWPTAAGAVPEVTRGLAELADAAAAEPAQPAHPPTMLVHCQVGTERSSLFVALCILICQLRTERRVDVCSAARKVRSQRSRTIDTFLHYEFLHRAILNYAELHNLLEDS